MVSDTKSSQAIRVAINGYGRIGRNIVRALFESSHKRNIQIVAINDMGNVDTNAHLTKYDSTHGKFSGTVEVKDNRLIINQQEIQVFSERVPANLPWGKLGVDIVFECTGLFTSKEKAKDHITAGAKKVIISAPGGSDIDATVVFGVNHAVLKSTHQIISNASCTTNCLAPIAKVLNDSIGLEQGLMTTIHSYTNDQVLVDSYHPDLYRARSATQSMIPTKTGAAQSIGLILPELKGKLDGFAMRVPTCNVSVVDLVFTSQKTVTPENIHEIMKTASQSAVLKDILAYNNLPLVSIDFNHHSASSIYDEKQTKVVGKLVKVLSWYDNEWGFSNRMLDVAEYWMSVK